MAKRTEALIKSALLVWARKSAGLTIEESAKKVKVKPQVLESWETGDKRPTIRQLRTLGKIDKPPIAVFYLPEPPKDFQPMRDFRRFPGQIAGTESPQLRLEIRRALDRREIALQLYEELEGKPPHFSAKANLSDDPEILATEIRNILGITREQQIGFRNDYEAFNWWQSALENIEVLVFQATGVDLSEMRGFSISETPFPVVVVNIKDSPRARIFTMLHDFVHVMLRDGGVCDLEEDVDRTQEENNVEVFCNRVAGAAIVSKDDLLQEDLVLEKGQGMDWTNKEIVELAQRYKVSREALLRRLLIFGRTTKEFYQQKKVEFEKEYKSYKEKSQIGFAPPYRMAISSAGHLFIRLVLNSYYQDNINTSDLSDFLNINLRHMRRLEQEVIGHSIEFGAIG